MKEDLPKELIKKLKKIPEEAHKIVTDKLLFGVAYYKESADGSIEHVQIKDALKDPDNTIEFNPPSESADHLSSSKSRPTRCHESLDTVRSRGSLCNRPS